MEESRYHFALKEFEDILIQHGLQKILKDMSGKAREVLCHEMKVALYVDELPQEVE